MSTQSLRPGRSEETDGASPLRNAPGPEELHEYPTTMAFTVNMIAMYLAVFCLALDYTILATAIPTISNEFGALDDIGWYASAYTLTQSAFVLVFGKIYSIFHPKWCFIVSLFIFEIGSLICGVAPSSVVLIVGRAIAGIGASGIFAGVLIIIAYMSPLEKRPIWQSLISGIFGISSVVAPLIGGAFTDNVTWRWCFYINLPVGVVAGVIIVLFLKITQRKSPLQGKSAWETFLLLDPVGFVLFVPSIICLFLALEWGGTDYPYSDGRIIALFTLFGVLIIAFVLVQWRLGETATIPFRIARVRTIWAASWFSFLIPGTFFVFIYFLPIYFQAIHGVSALQSSIDNLPFIISNVVFTVSSGFAVSRIGYVTPFCIGSSVLVSVGAGLLTTLTADTSTGRWIGYQIIFGAGIGLGFQQSPVAAQTALPFKDLPRGIALTLFFRNLGSSMFVTTGNTILDTNLNQRIEAARLPGVDPQAVLSAGATQFRQSIPTEQVGGVVDIYATSLQKVFQVGLILACLSSIGAACIQWKSLKAKKKQTSAGSTPSAETGNVTAEKR